MAIHELSLMKSDLRTEESRSASLLGWLGAVFMGTAVAVGAWVLAHVLINGPRARVMIEWQNANEIAQEDLALCGKFGAVPGTSAFRTCADELAQIRRRHHERMDPGVF
jgi:hypothetical protein